MKDDERAKSIWPRALGYFLAAMVLLTLLSRATDALMLPVVRCARPLPGALSHAVTLRGTIEAREQWPLMGEPDIAVARVYVRAGQNVRAGEALLRYDAEMIERLLEEKEAALKRLVLQARLEALEADQAKPENAEKEALQGQIARLDIDAAQRGVDRLTRLLYGGAVLGAPADGVIEAVLVQPGDTVAGALLRFSPASSGLVVRASVGEKDKEYLQIGMEARFQRAGETRAEEGTAVLTGLSAAAEGYQASFDLPAGAGGIGQTVSIIARRDTESFNMRVPLGAIVEASGTKGVYRLRTGQSVLGEMEYAEFVAVSVVESDGQYAAIDGALSERDSVIVSSSKPIRADDRVRSAS